MHRKATNDMSIS